MVGHQVVVDLWEAQGPDLVLVEDPAGAGGLHHVEGDALIGQCAQAPEAFVKAEQAAGEDHQRATGGGGEQFHERLPDDRPELIRIHRDSSWAGIGMPSGVMNRGWAGRTTGRCSLASKMAGALSNELEPPTR
ncbi:hypothetical protein MAJHIDBO_02258 [Propionibacterium freudenreichii subsp. shermanii]|nr:hypothetical protein MAJHIDBO_02258 [Propionibacterium freudenreichii subsp. shermanii]SPS10039.1 hypothetical protein MAJHIDBO_02258 [Propionibacterium freudenreichii subsp. shermanii]